LGFYLLIHADVFPRHPRQNLNVWIRRTGYVLIAAALGLLVFAPHPFWPIPPPKGDLPQVPAIGAETLRIVLFAIALVSAILLIWSVFFEISFHRKRLGLDLQTTVKSGSYSLCRHPGFWWFSFFSLSVAILRGLDLYFFTVSLMIGLDLFLIVIQDKYVFPRLFTGYDAYRKEVPFLVPRLSRRRPTM
jgi:protein-S-isoprenylcysteine O-methyltransferase Ste14